MEKREPFVFKMLKLMVAIIVSFNTLLLCFISAFIVLGVFVAVMYWSGSTSNFEYVTEYGDPLETNKILSVKVNGLILGDSSEAPSPFEFLNEGITFGYDIKQELIEAADDPEIKGVIVEINSPGGTIYGSRAIADGISYFQEQTNKPVIAYVGGLAASGGYMAAVPANSIVADHGSTVGSIGVIFGPLKYYDGVVSEGGLLQGEVITENGIETTYITAGRSKDLGNPYRQLTSAERTSLQNMVNSEYGSFTNFVSINRQIPVETIQNQIGAMIYDNATARAFGLIDDTKNKQQAYDMVAQAANIDSYQVVGKVIEYGFFETLFGTQAKSASKATCVAARGVLAYHGDLNVLCGSPYSK